MLRLSTTQFDSMRESLHKDRCDALARRIQAAFSDELERWDEAALSAQVRRTVARLQPLGFHEEQFLTHFALWDIFLGEGFESRDPEGLLESILHANRGEPMRFHDFRARLDVVLAAPSEQPGG